MPQALPMIAYWGATAAGAVGNYAWVAVAAAAVTSVMVADYQKDRQRERARAAARDRNVTVRSGVAPRRMVLGRARLGGPLMYAEFVGEQEEFIDTIVAHVHRQVHAVVGVYLDDEFVPVADIVDSVPTSGKYSGAAVQAQRLTWQGPVAASATSVTLDDEPNDPDNVQAILEVGIGEAASQHPLVVSGVAGAVVSFADPVVAEGVVYVTYSSNANPDVPLRLQWTLGTDAQASTTWSGVDTPLWTADHRLRGVAYSRMLIRPEADVFKAGTPQASLVIDGPTPVWDPRTDEWLDHTSNPALLAAWFRTLPRADGGMSVPSEWIDWPSVAVAANICDEMIEVRQLDGTGYEDIKRYECHTVLTLDGVDPLDNLKVILGAMAGDFPFTAGKYRCYAGAFRAAALTLTDADLAGDAPIHIAPNVGADQAPPNMVTATIYSAAHNWVETEAPPVVNAAYVSADGALEPLDIELPASTDLRQANYLMGVRLEQMRPAMNGSLTVKGVGANIALLDTLQLALTGYEALAGRTFEVRRRTNNWNGTYTLELREVRASTYTLDADRFTAPTEVTPGLGNFVPQPVAITSVVNAALRQNDGGTLNRALVTWAAHPQAMVTTGGWIDLRYRAPGADWVYAPPVPGSNTSTYLSPLGLGQVLFIEARARSGLGMASEWTGTDPFVVTGSDDVPPDPEDLAYAIQPGQVQITWTRWASAAYLETELRVGVSWAAGAFLWAGAASEYQHPRPPNGTYTVWAAHRNRSGNISATPASVEVTVDDSIDAAGVALLELQADGFAFVAADAAAATVAGPDITFTAVLHGVSGTATFVATAYNAAGTSLGTITLGGSGNVRTLTAAQFVSLGATTTRTVRVVATLGALSDSTTVYRGDGGSDAVQAALSNEAHTMPAAADGTVSSYTGSGTTIRVFQGLTELDYDGTGTANGKWTVSSSASNITRGSLSDSGLHLTVGQHSAMSADQASITYTITGKTTHGVSFSIVKVQSFAKSKTGATGSTGGSGTRGSLVGYGYGQYGISNASWSDQHANRTIHNMLNAASLTSGLASTTHLVIGDTVTLGNGTSFSATRFWSGSAWLEPGTVISGNLLVGGTISGTVNLNITGYAKIDGGNTYSVNISGSTESVTTAVLANNALANQYGVIGLTSTIGRAGLYGYNSNSGAGSVGVQGYSPNVGVIGYGGVGGVYGFAVGAGSGVGVYGVASASAGTGAGVYASNALNTANFAFKSQGKAEFTSQIHSTLATGNAPFVVASTTEVANLNVALLKGKTWAVPDPIGATTPNTGAFTTLSTSGLATLSSLRVNQAPTTGAATATFPGTNKPGSTSTCQWLPFNANGTAGHIPFWPSS